MISSTQQGLMADIGGDKASNGHYRWWYFDARSDDNEWSFVWTWFLGNPFSAYSYLSTLGKALRPLEHNAFFFSAYKHGKLWAYHYSRAKVSQVSLGTEKRPSISIAETSIVASTDTVRHLNFDDTNANGGRAVGRVTFRPVAGNDIASSSFIQSSSDAYRIAPSTSPHTWFPIIPQARVEGTITLCGNTSNQAERIVFEGNGYHDYNEGVLPFTNDFAEWYWARATCSGGYSVILYWTKSPDRELFQSVFLLRNSELVASFDQPQFEFRRRRISGFLVGYWAQIAVQEWQYKVVVDLNERVDSSPFYIRFLCSVQLMIDGNTFSGKGFAEYFKPQLLSSPISAFATETRITKDLID